MSTRKPAVTTQLKNANLQIIDLEKKLKDCENTKKWASDRATALENELEQVHSFLDAVPNSIPRDAGDYKKNGAMTRLAAWLSVKGSA